MEELVEKVKSSNKLHLIILFFCVLIIAIPLATYAYKNYFVKDKPTVNSNNPKKAETITILPDLKPVDKAKIENCTLPAKDNPILESDFRKVTERTTLGVLRGNIDEVKFKDASKSATVKLLSPGAIQYYEFELKDEPGLVYDTDTQQEVKVKDIKRGQAALISVNCYTTQKPPFRIAQISIGK